MANFYDTCALLNLQNKAFEKFFYFSSVTLQELERIKSSGTKDEDTKYRARHLLNLLVENKGKYQVYQYNPAWDSEIVEQYGIQVIDDSRIAYTAFKNCPNLTFVTDDLCCGVNAEIFGLTVDYDNFSKEEDYTGYKEVDFTDIELATFYNTIQSQNKNCYDLFDNEYLIVKLNGQIVDKYKWLDNKYIEVNNGKIHSKFDDISAKDEYQQLAIDSLQSNQLTVLRGKPGSGKSYIGLGYLYSLLEKGNINKIIIFCNTVATKDSCKLGFYPGSKDEKLLDSQIGNFLIGKFGGDRGFVEKLVADGDILLVPIADCRGMDTTGMNAGIYITEAQNATKDMMQLVLQRIGEDSKVVIEGDDKTQVDMSVYNGANNGLRRLSEVFRGEKYYGEVTLKNCHRSRIAERAELM